MLAFRSIPTPFGGEGASAGLTAAVTRAAADIGGGVPDLVLLVRGGSARTGLALLDGEDLARAIAGAPVPVIVECDASDSRTRQDGGGARVTSQPGATTAKAVLLLAAAIRHGGGWTPQVLAPRDGAARELVEAGRRIRADYGRAGGHGEARTIAI